MKCPNCRSTLAFNMKFCPECGAKYIEPKGKVRTKMYLHGEKESNYELGEKLGLSEEAIKNFAYALYEVEFEVEVDTKTGDYTIIAVNGRKLA